MDWRFNEFPNAGVHALYVTCVEIMGLPVDNPTEVGSRLLDVILEGHHLIGPDNLPDWINAIGLLLSNLPEAYSNGLTQAILSALTSQPLVQWTLPQTIFQVRPPLKNRNSSDNWKFWQIKDPINSIW